MKERLLFVHFAVERVPSRFTSLPSHITIVSWFEMDSRTTSTLAEAVRPITRGLPTIHTTAGEERMFGRHEDILVNVLRHGPYLRELHESLIYVVQELGGEMDDLDWSGANYSPHITRKPDLAFSPGDEFIIRSLSLVRAVSETPKLREVVEHFQW